MHQILLAFHSINRWLVLAFLSYGIFLALRGFIQHKPFRPHDNFIRHVTATISHVQLLLGVTLYMISPIVKFSQSIADNQVWVDEQVFFKYIHISLMVIAVVCTTIGSAKAKRMPDDQSKFQTMLFWFSLSLIVIFIAIPWPFSPLANRPFLRNF